MAPCYVVFEGYTPGIYFTWHECSLQVFGYKNARYKKYQNYEQALHHYKQLLFPNSLFLLIVLLLLLHYLTISLEIGRMWWFWLFCCWFWLFWWDWPCLGNATAMSRPMMTLIHLWSLFFASPACAAFLSRKLLNCILILSDGCWTLCCFFSFF